MTLLIKSMNEKKTRNLDAKTVISESLRTALINEKKTYIAARTSHLQRGTVEKILTQMKEQLKLKNTEQALSILAILFQQGGTARSCDGNLSTTIFDREFKLADIRKILKQMSCNKAERKLARTLATEIQEIALLMEIPGNLYLKIQKNDLERNFTAEEKAWLSDFQSDNENCPVGLRNLIIDTFKNSKSANKKKIPNA